MGEEASQRGGEEASRNLQPETCNLQPDTLFPDPYSLSPSMDDELADQSAPRKHWRDKFAHALHGLRVGVHGHSSFFVHFFSTALVIAAALAMGMEPLEWAILLGCVAAVLTAEMFNSAIESLARALEKSSDPHVRDALDIASSAVLLNAAGAAVVGLLIFLRRFAELMGWW